MLICMLQLDLKLAIVVDAFTDAGSMKHRDILSLLHIIILRKMKCI